MELILIRFLIIPHSILQFLFCAPRSGLSFNRVTLISSDVRVNVKASKSVGSLATAQVAMVGRWPWVGQVVNVAWSNDAMDAAQMEFRHCSRPPSTSLSLSLSPSDLFAMVSERRRRSTNKIPPLTVEIESCFDADIDDGREQRRSEADGHTPKGHCIGVGKFITEFDGIEALALTHTSFSRKYIVSSVIFRLTSIEGWLNFSLGTSRYGTDRGC